jgi:hypothetical protein
MLFFGCFEEFLCCLRFRIQVGLTENVFGSVVENVQSVKIMVKRSSDCALQ